LASLYGETRIETLLLLLCKPRKPKQVESLLLLWLNTMGKVGQVGTMVEPGSTEAVYITVQLTSCLTCLDLSVLQIITKFVSCHTVDSKPVKQEVNSTVILPPLVFHGRTLASAFLG
jgi:hypothetical protein